MRYYFSLFFYIFFISGCHDTGQIGKENICNGMKLSHIFEDDLGRGIGFMCINKDEDNSDLFNEMRIYSSSKDKVIYQIKNNLLLTENGTIDTEINAEGFLGYQIVLKNKRYVVLSCCGDNVSDDLTIEWDSDAKKFNLLRTP